MASIDNLQRAGAFLRSAFDDDDLRRQVREAFRSGRNLKADASGRRKAPPRTLIDRAGRTLSASSAAALALGRVEEPERSSARRTVVALLIAGGLVAAVAAQEKTTTQGVTHGV